MARASSIAAAEALFGVCEDEYISVVSAWDAVQVPGISAEELCGQLQVADVREKANFRVFPNPSNGIVTIENNGASEAELSILSIDGKLIRKEKLNAAISHQLKIDLPKGLYLFKVDRPKNSSVMRVIVQ